VLASRWFLPAAALGATGAFLTLYSLWRSGEEGIGLARMSESFHYLLAQFQVLATYLRLLVWPAGLTIDHDFRPAPALSAYGLTCALFVAAILACTFLIRKRLPAAALLLAAFLIMLAPTSSIIPSRDLLFEHRLYMPMIAAAIGMAWLLLAAFRAVFPGAMLRTGACLLGFCLLLAGYSAASAKRTYVWGETIRLWEDAVAKAPDKSRPHYNLGVAFLDRDRARARDEFLQTVKLDAGHAAALYDLGWLAQTDGAWDEARRYYARALAADPKTWQAHHNLGNLSLLQGDLPEAAKEFAETIRLRPDYWPAHLNLAAAQLRSGDTQAALRTIEALKRLRWDLLEARLASAEILLRQSRYGEAAAELRFAAEHDAAGGYRDRIQALRKRIPAQMKSLK